MLDVFLGMSDYIYNNILYYYYIYVTIYKYYIYIRFYITFIYNFYKYNIISNKLLIKVLKPFLFIYSFITRILVWINRRFLKKKKRFRIYYKYQNFRYWKFIIFFMYIYVFFLLWKKRNLYTKLQFLFFFIFLHVLILLLLNFFIGFFNSYDVGFLSCMCFVFIIIFLFKR